MSSWRCCAAVAVRGRHTWRDAVHVLVVRLRRCRIGNEWAFRGSDDAHDVSQVGVRVGSCAGLWVERVAGLVVVLRLKGEGLAVLRVPGFAQIADRVTHNRPFPPFFAEVVCTLGGMPIESATLAPSGRGLATWEPRVPAMCPQDVLLLPCPRTARAPDTWRHRARRRSPGATAAKPKAGPRTRHKHRAEHLSG